jgi:hypothetical protein
MNVVARWRKQIIKLATARAKTLQHQRHQRTCRLRLLRRTRSYDWKHKP